PQRNLLLLNPPLILLPVIYYLVIDERTASPVGYEDRRPPSRTLPASHETFREACCTANTRAHGCTFHTMSDRYSTSGRGRRPAVEPYLSLCTGSTCRPGTRREPNTARR